MYISLWAWINNVGLNNNTVYLWCELRTVYRQRPADWSNNNTTTKNIFACVFIIYYMFFRALLQYQICLLNYKNIFLLNSFLNYLMGSERIKSRFWSLQRHKSPVLLTWIKFYHHCIYFRLKLKKKKRKATLFSARLISQ